MKRSSNILAAVAAAAMVQRYAAAAVQKNVGNAGPKVRELRFDYGGKRRAQWKRERGQR